MSQPVPPSFKDLGKACNDLLSKDYPIVGAQLEVKTKAPNGVTFKVDGLKHCSTGAIAGNLEAKYLYPKYGLSFTPAWSTSNLVKATVELDNQIAKGVKIDLNTSLNPVTGAKTALLTTTYKQPGLHTRGMADLFRGPLFTLDAVVGRDGFLVGGDATYDVQKASINRYNAAIGYSAPEYAVTLHGLGNLTTFHASYYHKVNRDVEAGAKAIYDIKSPSSAVSLEVGTRAYLDNASFVKARINNSGILGLGYTQALRPGVKMSLGLALDTQKLGGELGEKAVGGQAHKVGASLTFES